jgi:hypothetical protein
MLAGDRAVGAVFSHPLDYRQYILAEWRLTGNGHEIFAAILDRLLASKELERGFSSGGREELAAKPLQHRHNLLVGGYG